MKNIEQKVEIILYSNYGIPYLPEEIVKTNEEVKRAVSVGISMSEFDYYMSLSPDEKLRFLKEHSDFIL